MGTIDHLVAFIVVVYILTRANTVARDSVRKTISANDIYKGLENVGLAGFIPTVQEQVEKYEAYNSQKKKEPKKTGSPTSEIVDLEDDIKSDEEMEYSEPKSEGNKRPKVISASVDKVKKRGRKQGNNKYEDNQGTTTEMDVDDIKPGQEDQDEQQSDELEDERSQAIDGEDEGDEEGEEDEEGEGDEGEDEEEANQKTQDDGEEDEEDEDVVKDLDQEGSVHNESDDDSDNDQNFNVK